MLIRRIAVVALALAALFAANYSSAQVTGDTNFHPNTKAMTDPPTGDYCGSLGGGCYEAWRTDGSVLIYDSNVGAAIGEFFENMIPEAACELLPFPFDWICGFLFW
ncbi:MAG TPA: hypothetical protein P5234_10190 [Thermoanaerobaculaceae bacterium]|nr:hypothetical protein [Thermoanaerobaculaceae bacterium]HRS16597.1 hypothetical protein [Thermoanaerobaculaceae bacterium]